MSDESKPLKPVSLPLPRRLDFRAAFETYVTGRHKAVPVHEKIAANSDRLEAMPDTVGRDSGAANAALSPRASVGIPRRLKFHRGAGTWRAGLPLGASQHGVDRD